MTAFAIVGFGEVGSIFARDLHQGGALDIAAYDVAEEARDRAAATGYAAVRGTARAAVAEADVVFVSVTAGSVLEATTALAGGLSHRPFVVDVNSVSPATKQRAAAIVAAGGGRYVEAAVMSSVPPHGLRSPMLLAGSHAQDWLRAMAPFRLRAEVLDSSDIGAASSVKMCRSIMVKGLEALAAECMLTARHHGVEDRVMASLADTLPHPDWPGLARYLIGRALLHGRRRAEEMEEVARTVEDAGLEPVLSRAIAERQGWAHRRGCLLSPEERSAPELGVLLDALAGLERRAAGDGTPRRVPSHHVSHQTGPDAPERRTPAVSRRST